MNKYNPSLYVYKYFERHLFDYAVINSFYGTEKISLTIQQRIKSNQLVNKEINNHCICVEFFILCLKSVEIIEIIKEINLYESNCSILYLFIVRRIFLSMVFKKELA